MGAKRNINVTGTDMNTAAATAAKSYTHFQIFEANGTTPVSNPCALTNAPHDVAIGGFLNVADAGIAIKLGAAGANNVGQLADAVLVRMLDSETLDGTEVIKFGTSAAMADSGNIAPFTSVAWDAAVTF